MPQTRTTEAGSPTLWGGRFIASPAKSFWDFNSSFRFDYRLLQADLEGSIAYAEELCAIKILSKTEKQKIAAALKNIRRRFVGHGTLLEKYFAEYEDVHSFVEAQLIEAVGDLGKKLHTGRSRNDQVAVDLRLFLKKEIRATQNHLLQLMSALAHQAEKHQTSLLPGYTHLQRAQPITFAHQLLAYFEMFSRDMERLENIYKQTDALPLGAGALAGSGFPINRQRLARRLGFSRVTLNSMDAVSDRDYVIDFHSAAALILMHLSRLAEDFILFTSQEFGFLELSDEYTSGSSLMPQKKNPDTLELIRGKAGRVFGHLHAQLTTLKGLPLTYNKDLQEDKEALFDTLDTTHQCVKMAAGVVSTMSIHTTRMKEAAEDVPLGGIVATELADYLVRKGVPFRDAHRTVGQLVRFCLEHDYSLRQLSLEQFQKYSPRIEEDVYDALRPDCAVARKNVVGGTAPVQVKRAVAVARQRLNQFQRMIA